MFKYVLAFALVAAVSCDVSHLLAHRNNGEERHANILRQESDIQPDGSYQWAYETDNGIQANEQGNIRVLGAEQVDKTAQGGFQWTSPEGKLVQISYLADQDGYQPQGDAIPTPPPVPIAIARALEWIAAHPQQPERKF